ncbi:Structural maintenance of chromosomes protein [Dirofilaria immitis]
MDAAAGLSTAQLKQNERVYPMHLTAELFKKRRKLLKERATFAEEEGNMWEHSKAVLVQNIDDDENLKQSRQACKEISKLLHCSAKSLQLISMNFEAASELTKTTVDAVEVTSKDNILSVETFTARFETLKIRAQNDWEIIQEKLQQSAKIDNALIALENGLNHLLRHGSLKEQAEHLRKMHNDREQLLKMEHEELLNRVKLLKLKLEMKNSATNQKLQQQFYEAEAELKNILSTDIEDLHEVIKEEKDLQQQLHACSQEYDKAVVELSKLDEQNEKILDKERMLDEKITILKTKLEKLTAFKRDDHEIISLRYKNIRENLQREMNVKVRTLKDEVKRVQTELNCRGRKRLKEMITAERKASAVLHSKRVEIDIECSQLELETNVLHDSNNAEMMQHETEISDFQKYLDKLVTEEKVEKQHYEAIRSRTSIIIRSEKYACLRGSRWLTTADNVTNTLFDEANFEIGMSHTVRKFEDERIMDSEGTGKVPSDIHISHVDQIDLNAVDIIKADANLGNHYPLPPSAFGSPLSTNNSPDVTTDSEINSSEFDQSVWSDFSSVIK